MMHNQEQHTKNVIVRGLVIGEGTPKICVSMTGTTLEELHVEALALKNEGADLAEWRVDWFTQWTKDEMILKALSELRELLEEIPLLVTFRTQNEGGHSSITKEEYDHLYEVILSSGYADMIDLELFFDGSIVTKLIQRAKECGVKTVLSNHDFDQTPAEEELSSRLHQMETLGSDIAKIAVMPRSTEDVASLLKVTARCAETMKCPLITVSMGEKGAISRMAGQVFGSAVTFGTIGKASAPGQIPIKQLKLVLALIGDTKQ